MITDHPAIFSPSTPNVCKDCGVDLWLHAAGHTPPPRKGEIATYEHKGATRFVWQGHGFDSLEDAIAYRAKVKRIGAETRVLEQQLRERAGL